MKTREEALKERYGFSKGSYNYIPKGAEILKLIGIESIFVDFKKDETGQWINEVKKCWISEINDYNPMNMTYNCKYKLIDNPEEEHEVRIIPEGYSWGDPEETGTMCRFLPYSMHCKMVEDEAFYYRVSQLWNTRNTLPLEGLKVITENKTQAELLRYSRNIGAAIRLSSDESILWFRIERLNVRHKQGTKYNLLVSDGIKTYSFLVDSEMTDYDFEGIGRMKLIDLQSEEASA